MLSVARQARPLLGTLVSMEVTADEAAGHAAMDVAFKRIAAVHQAMSFHEAQSDLRQLARSLPGQIVVVSSDTYEVLALALQLESESKGIFNVCCAARLAVRGLLPFPPDALAEGAASLLASIELLDGRRVGVRSTPWIDLGGIAKGYAVDAAVESLLAHGVEAGVVNAGGDLRVFGGQAHTLRIRDPRDPAAAIPVASVCDMACATSAWALNRPGPRTDHLVGPELGIGENAPMSVTVFAPSCAAADALTKVVWNLGAQSLPLLQSRGAEALVWYASGVSERLWNPPR